MILFDKMIDLHQLSGMHYQFYDKYVMTVRTLSS